MNDQTEALQTWFGQRLPGAKLRSEVSRRPMGFSNDTFVIDLVWQPQDGSERAESFVLRAPPAGQGLLAPYDLSKQFGVMDKLAGSAVPVPAMLWYESDESVLGREFFVMEKVDGIAFESTVPSEFADTSAVAQEEMVRRAIRAIADVHRFDWRAAGIDFLGEGQDFLRLELERWAQMYSSSAADTMPAFEQMLAWLRQEIPIQSKSITLVHGDAKWGNFLWSPQGELLSLLDWEMCGVGDPLTDLAYHLTMAFMGGDTFSPLPQGLSHDEIVALYASSSGVEVHDLRWYEALQAFKLAAILLRMHRMFVDGETGDLRFALVAPAVEAFIRRALACADLDLNTEIGPISVPPRRVAEAFAAVVAEVIVPDLTDEYAVQQAQMITYVAAQAYGSA